jgi:hypothetical protein
VKLGPDGNLDANYLEPDKRPGGYGPTARPGKDRPVMLSELCEALRDAAVGANLAPPSEVLDRLADRLERKP